MNENIVNMHIDESSITNVGDYNLIKEEIICEICYGIAIKPKICKSCETLFCENCINNWKNKNNSCPKRCSNFIIQDAPKVVKKLLDKIEIKCEYCQNNFKYEIYVNKHFPECYEKNRLVKCPFCTDCKIKHKLIQDYENILKKNKSLLNEINELKETLKSLNYIDYKWNSIQNKKNFILSNNNKTIKIDYVGCFNVYTINYDFKDKIEYTLGISMNTFGNEYDCIYIGFMNENALNNNNSLDYCACQELDNLFYIQISSEKIYEGKKKYEIKLDNKTKINLKFILNLKTNKLDIRNYDSDNSYKVINVYGNKFTFFVGKCNSGIIEYTILP